MLPAGFAYAGSLLFALSTYLNPVWGYYGFTFEAPGVNELAAGSLLIALVSLTMPVSIAGAANIILFPLYVVVFVPTIVFTLTVVIGGAAKYGPALGALAAVFLLACLLTRDRVPATERKFWLPAEYLLLAVCAALATYLVAKYRSVMAFTDITSTSVYEQRALGAATGAIDGYAQTYFAYVFCPAVLAIGLVRHRVLWIGAGLAGFVAAYMISANRTVILLPLAMIVLFAQLTIRWRIFRSSALTVCLLAGIVAWAAAHHEDEGLSHHLAVYLVFRTVGLPGLMFSQYYDLFTAEGFTWWAHVKGMSLIVPQPLLAEHAAWPSLGYIMGDLVYKNIEVNHNAHLFASDGLAAAGALGVTVIGVVFSAWLWVLTHLSQRWDPVLTTLLLLPLGIVLTNGQFSTGLLSFGGLFWLLLLWGIPQGK